MERLRNTFLLLLLYSAVIIGQVTVTPASGGTDLARSTSCANGTPGGYASLGNIVITETVDNDIKQSQSNVTLILSAPSNWQFNTAVGSVSTTAGDDITSISLAVAAATLTVTFTTANGNAGKDTFDEITITAIEVQSIDGNTTPAAGDILSSASSSADITGITHGTTNFGSLSTDPGSPLPVELLSFSVGIHGDIANLQWSTATEINNYGFEIERSLTEGVWEYLGFVEGHGTSFSPKKYDFLDNLSILADDSLVYSLNYRLKQIDLDGTFEYYYPASGFGSRTITSVDDELLPEKFELFQNYPNPFNPATTIKYTIPATVLTPNSELRTPNSEQFVNLTIYDILGREAAVLVNKRQSPGEYTVSWDAASFPSGLYLYKLTYGNFSDIRKMILLR